MIYIKYKKYNKYKIDSNYIIYIKYKMYNVYL